MCVCFRLVANTSADLAALCNLVDKVGGEFMPCPLLLLLLEEMLDVAGINAGEGV
jgi:hypothetical protein